MKQELHARKTYPVSLQCAAEAVFGPNDRLKTLLKQPASELTEKDRMAERASKRRI